MKLLASRLRAGNVSVERAELNSTTHSADVKYWFDGKTFKGAKIRVDGAQDGEVVCVIHELLHTVLDTPLDSVLNLELREAAIAGIEVHLVQQLEKKPDAYEAWRRAVNRKLKEAA